MKEFKVSKKKIKKSKYIALLSCSTYLLRTRNNGLPPLNRVYIHCKQNQSCIIIGQGASKSLSIFILGEKDEKEHD